MKRSEIRELFDQAKNAYNSILGTDFNDNNLLLELCTAKGASNVFEVFCTEHFPHYLKSNSYKDRDFFKNTKGMAFVEGNMNGILYITDVHVPKINSEWQGNVLSVLLHEIGHIVCMIAEFSDTKTIPSMEGKYIPAIFHNGKGAFGYRVWREMITDMLGNHIHTKMTGRSREQINRERLAELFYEAKYGKFTTEALPRMISEILTIQAVVNSNSWDEAYKTLQNQTYGLGFIDKIFPICQTAYKQMKENGIFITKEFLCEFEDMCSICM